MPAHQVIQLFGMLTPFCHVLPSRASNQVFLRNAAGDRERAGLCRQGGQRPEFDSWSTGCLRNHFGNAPVGECYDTFALKNAVP